MAQRSKIEWTEATWNPITGCTKVSPGCDHCYASTFAERWRGTPGHYFERGFDITLRPDKLDLPLRWRRPRRIFVNSMSDLFHDSIPDEYIARVFAVMALAERHTLQVLTKRHGRMRSLLGSANFRNLVLRAGIAMARDTGGINTVWAARALDPDNGPAANVWLGVSVENQQWANIRIPVLLDTPAAVRWISAEPLLGPIDLGAWLRDVDSPSCWDVHAPSAECGQCIRPDWIVCGGESGPGARPMHPDWARWLRNQCVDANVPFLFKQHGEWAEATRTTATHLLHVTKGYLIPRADGTTDHPYGEHSGLDQDLVDRGHPGWIRVRRWGKKAAGREMDGRTWDQYPAERAAADATNDTRS